MAGAFTLDARPKDVAGDENDPWYRLHLDFMPGEQIFNCVFDSLWQIEVFLFYLSSRPIRAECRPFAW